jgi:tetratricopeptide (TPR) repeat protein
MGTPSSAAAEPLYRKGLWYQRQGQIEQAIAMYEEALRLSPNHSAAGSALLSATLETDAFDKACTLGTELHARHPEDHRVALNLAIALVGCARPKEAISLLDRQAALPEPRLFEIFFHKGVAYRQLGEGAKAVEQYRKAEAMRPWDSRLMFNLALAFEREADYPEAIRYYRKCLVVLPPSEVRMRDRVGRRVALLEDNIGVSGPAHRETP